MAIGERWGTLLENIDRWPALDVMHYIISNLVMFERLGVEATINKETKEVSFN